MKPESRFIKGVHDLLHPDVYCEKTHNVYRGGTPDCYYMGFNRDLWVEWKWMPKFPALIDVSPFKKGHGRLSMLQLNWLSRAWDRGRHDVVIVGSPTGCVIFADLYQCTKGIARDEAQVLSKKAISNWIQDKCGLEHSATQQSG